MFAVLGLGDLMGKRLGSVACGRVAHSVAFWGLLLSSLPGGWLLAEPAPKAEIQIPRLSSAPKIDGHLEEIWEEAAVMDDFFEIEPGKNLPAKVSTVAYLAYDQDHLYLAVRCFDDEPQHIRAVLTDRDNVFDDDFVMIFLDTFNDQRRAYEFVVNPYGVQGDLIRVEGSHEEDISFDAIWDSAGSKDEKGWTAEAAIPFKSLRFQNAEVQTWGIFVLRNYPRDSRYQFLSRAANYDDPCIICQMDKLVGMEGVQAGRNLEIVPTLTAQYTEEPAAETDRVRRDVDAGVTVKYGVTPNVNLDFALNPDFSQVEADVDQLDVNVRSALFYPEKRPFFQEGRDYFRTHGSLNLFHSRAIADPIGAGKVTGKIGGNQFAILTAHDESPAIVVADSEGSSVIPLASGSQDTLLRYRRDLFSSSSVGAFVSDMRVEGGGHSTVIAADALVRPFRSLDFSAVLAHSEADALGSEELQRTADGSPMTGNAISFSAGMEGRNYNWRSTYTDIDSDFRADLGFLRRTDLKQWEIEGEYSWIPENHPVFDRIGPHVEFSRAVNHAGEEALKEAFAGLTGSMKGQIFFVGGFGENSERMEETLFEGLRSWFWFFRARPSQLFSASIHFNPGDRVDYRNLRVGKGYGLEVESTLRPTDRLSFDLALQRETLNRKESEAWVYSAQAARLKAVYQFTSRFFVRSILQYSWVSRDPSQYFDTVEAKERELNSYVLVSYKINPQTVFFAGYNDSFAQEYEHLDDLERTSRTFFVKLGYNFRP